MKRRIVFITIVVTVLIMFIQVVQAQQSTEYRNWLPMVVGESTPAAPEVLLPGDYLSRSGEWVVTFTEPKPIIDQEFVGGYLWFFVEIRYKDYPSITAWIREWDID